MSIMISNADLTISSLIGFQSVRGDHRVVPSGTKSIEEALMWASNCLFGYSGVNERMVFKPKLARKGTCYQ